MRLYNPVNKQVSDFDCAAASPVGMSCSSVSAGKLSLCSRDCLSMNHSLVISSCQCCV